MCLIPPSLRHVMTSLDCCVWPSNMGYLQACLQALHSVLAMFPKCGGHLQVPMPQAQTVPQALVKHRRILEDFLIGHNMDITKNVTLIFQTSSGSTSADKRSLVHPCLFVSSTNHNETNVWSSSAPVQMGHIADIPLIRVNEMLGYDLEVGSRPGASARTEQTHGLLVSCVLA